MYAHDSALAPLVRGTIDTLSPLREHCSAAQIIDAVERGVSASELLPTHPLLESCARVQSVRIYVAFGANISVEVEPERPARQHAKLQCIDAGEAQRLLTAGAIPVLLGVDRGAVLRLAVLASDDDSPAAPDTTAYSSDPRSSLHAGSHQVSLREWAHYLDDDDTYSALMMTALAQWHTHCRYCSRCGAALSATHCGWVQRCERCGALEYPRQDPAVIMAVTDEQDRLLLAHNALWAPRRVSVLAGFVDAGEAPERAVVREVWEEVRVHVDRVRALGTQPWPFPRSLMLAYEARVVSGASTAVQTQPEEIEWAQWYSRDSLKDAVLAGEILLPGLNTIAHGLIRRWYGAALPVAR